jgi:hypothetical protein
MLSQNMRIKIQLICYATVSSFFSSMINVKYRGEGFTWDSFPRLVKSQCRIQVCLMIPSYKRMKQEIDTCTEDFASAIARDMMQNAGVLEGSGND